MANILLTEEEYNAVQSLHADAIGKIESATPRLAGHYRRLAKIHADFLNKEDAKRALRTQKQSRQAEMDQKSQARRAAALQVAQQRIADQQKGVSGNAGQAPASGAAQTTGRQAKAS